MHDFKISQVKCPYKSECPGCSRINQSYPQQMRVKQQEINEVFKGVPLSPVAEMRPLIASTHPWGYRTSTKLCLSVDPFGRKIIGLYRRHSKKTYDIPACPVHHPAINRALEVLFGKNREFVPAPFYDHQDKKFQLGKLKFITLRLSPDGKSLSVLISHTGVDRKALEAWAEPIDLTGTSLFEGTLTPKDGSLVIPHRTQLLAGDPKMTYRLPSSGATFPLTPSVFFQANGPMTELFIKTVTQSIEETKGAEAAKDETSNDCLLDLYGGFGSYSFPLKDRFKKVWIVEANKAAIDAAVAYMKSNPSCHHVTPCHQTVESFFADHQDRSPSKKSSILDTITHCIVNPPRTGLGEEVAKLVVERLPQLRRLVYVSCHPESMVKDLKFIMRKTRFKVDTIQPMDMFPQTEHLETVVSLKR